MISSTSSFSERIEHQKNTAAVIIRLERLLTLVLFLIGLATLITTLIALPSTSPFTTKPHQPVKNNSSFLLHPADDIDDECDLYEGNWIPEENGSSYPSSSQWIPDWANCYKNGRMDVDFVKWRWKPHGCELPRFDAKLFLDIVRDKRLLFLGDSVAKNQMESLICLLSQVAVPEEIENHPGDFRTIHFDTHNFTVEFLRSTFLVMSEEIFINGSSSGAFNIQLDRADERWAHKLPGTDYVVISSGPWFFRKNYLYERGNLIGCLNCDERNVADQGVPFAIQKVFRTALKFINDCTECRRLITLLRTFSPAHFENGAWSTGGYCNRTSPLSQEDISLQGSDWQIRSIQVEEIERAKEEAGGNGRRFEALDITGAMLMRPDGHPGSHRDKRWAKDINDCLHWCLPGPIDTWNALLLAVMRKEMRKGFIN